MASDRTPPSPRVSEFSFKDFDLLTEFELGNLLMVPGRIDKDAGEDNTAGFEMDDALKVGPEIFRDGSRSAVLVAVSNAMVRSSSEMFLQLLMWVFMCSAFPAIGSTQARATINLLLVCLSQERNSRLIPVD